jgi:hypothetical protein
MSESSKRSDSLAGLWNDKCELATKLTELVQAFQLKYAISGSDTIEIRWTDKGALVKVTL